MWWKKSATTATAIATIVHIKRRNSKQKTAIFIIITQNRVGAKDDTKGYKKNEDLKIVYGIFCSYFYFILFFIVMK